MVRPVAQGWQGGINSGAEVMAKKKNPTLTKEFLWRNGGYQGMTPCQSAAIRFCQDVLSGKNPNKADMIILANALKPIEFAHSRNTAEVMNEVAENLGLHKTSGRKLSEERNYFQYASEVAGYFLLVESLILQGVSDRGAEKEARTIYMEKLGIGDRAMRDKINKHQDQARLMLPLLRNYSWLEVN